MVHLDEYINEQLNQPVVVDESLVGMTALRKVGMLVLSVVMPFLISVGVRIASLKLDPWVDKLREKYPKFKDAIDIMADVLKDNLNKMDRCRTFIVNSENQKPSRILTTDDICSEILPLISSEEDKKKVSEFLDTIDSVEFKEEIDEI